MDFSKTNNNLLYANYNKEQDCVIFGTTTGFYVYTLYPQKKIISCKINGGVSKISMLHRSNIFFFVGTQDIGEYSKKTLNIWDDSKKSIVGQINFTENISHMEIYTDNIFISTENNIYLYNFDNLQLLHTLPIGNNISGIFKVIVDKHLILYADTNTIKLYNWDTTDTNTIDSHIDNINLFSISNDNTLLATCSHKGSIIRIFDIETLTLLKELRRGTEYVTISDLTFNKEGTLLLCSSDKGTIHIFSIELPTSNKKSSIKDVIEDDIPENNIEETINEISPTLIAHSAIKNHKIYGSHYFKSFLPTYFNSEWSFIQIYLKNLLSYNVFSKDKNTILSIASNGCFYIIEYTYDMYTGKTSHKIISTLKFLSDHNDPFDHRNSTIL
tara:strand:+ start:413 stop:1567 length:1155 start_codon:yes stop_codon:yes gene_type:complete